MERFNRISLKFIIYFSPVVVIAMILDLLGFNSGKPEQTPNYYFFEVVGWTTMIWCALLVYLFFAIGFNEKLKNTVVRKLARINENDEREVRKVAVIGTRVRDVLFKNEKDVLGKTILEQKVGSKKTQIDISNFANGLYILKAENVEQVRTVRIIKQ